MSTEYFRYHYSVMGFSSRLETINLVSCFLDRGIKSESKVCAREIVIHRLETINLVSCFLDRGIKSESKVCAREIVIHRLWDSNYFESFLVKHRCNAKGVIASNTY